MGQGQGKSKHNDVHQTQNQSSTTDSRSTSTTTTTAATSGGSPTKPTPSPASTPSKRVETNADRMTLEELFDKYKAPADDETAELDTIVGDGIMRFCEDLGIDPMDITLMVLFWKLKLAEKYTITKSEFVNGFKQLRMENVAAMRQGIPQLKSELSTRSSFKEFYLWCFQYMKESTAKTLTVDLAVPTWKLVLQGRYKYIDDWCKFIEEVQKKAVSHDTWEQFLDFIQTVGSDFSKYDADGAWPVAIDEFVEHMQSRRSSSTSAS